MNLARFQFSILPCVDFQHICTGNPRTDCFLHLGQHPHISYSDEIMGEDGVEPPEPESNRFTVCTATSTEYSPKTRAPRVSNMFIVLCFPLGCFIPCQPHEVVSDIIMPFDFMFLENSLVINARLWWLIETKKHLSDGKSDQAQAYAVTYLCSFWFTYAHPKVFSAHKTDG